MTHGSLFSGIGGFDLAASWMGWENVFHCEWEDFPRMVLSFHFPNSISYGDITKTDFTIHRGQIDVLSGGFPCQPFSTHGKRLGKHDDRHLWPEMCRAIREIAPSWVVGENVRGIINWSGGLVFDEVQADLEAEGYEVIPFLLPACGIGAVHRRDRIWFVAHTTGKRDSSSRKDCEFKGYRGENNDKQEEWVNSAERTDGFPRLEQPSPKVRDWRDFPTQPFVCGRDDGIPRELDSISFPKWRNESVKAYGNAVVPHIPYKIFQAIQEYEILQTRP